MQPFSLEGEVALVTGGGTGLGYAIASCLAQAGAQVIIVGRREDQLQRAADEIGSHAAYMVFDVRELESAEGMVRQVSAQHGPITILVNNAGTHLKKKAEETSIEEFRAVLDTHLMGSFALSRAAIPVMKQAGRGSILFIASMASFLGIPDVVAYAAAKSAYLGMMRTMAAELGSAAIRVNAIAPGWIESDMLRGAIKNSPEREQRILTRTPMGRFGQPEDIGWAAVYLCSPAAQFVTGVVLPVDGGGVIGF